MHEDRNTTYKMKELAIQYTKEEADAWNAWLKEEKRKMARDDLTRGMTNLVQMVPFGMRWEFVQQCEKTIELYVSMM